MTNHWTDIGNASLVLVIGANPAENHPACMAHVNAARFDIHHDDAGNPVNFNRKARLIVVDPRRTRTAQQTENSGNDLYVRIRPGTDIAFINGVMKAVFDDFASATPYNATAKANFIGWHNGTTVDSTGTRTTAPITARSLIDDTGTTRLLSPAELAGVPGFGAHADAVGLNRGWPKYTDARVKLNDPSSRADQDIVLTGTTATALGHLALSSVVVRQTAGGTQFTEGTDYSVDYLSGEIIRVGSGIASGSHVFVSYSYQCDDYARTTMRTASWTTGADWQFSNMMAFLNDFRDAGSVYNKLRAHLAPYDLATVANICGCSTADLTEVAHAFIDNSRFADADYLTSQGPNGIDVTKTGYRATTLLYAMGATQHSCGSQMIHDYAVLQSMMGNMGRPGGGINALRGIHNVQGSTDIGLLFDSIPGYSGNPKTAQGYPAYANGLFGNRLTGNTASGATAAATTLCAAANSNLTYTSKLVGVAGNTITVAYVDPGANNAAIAVTVVGKDIAVSLATGLVGAITSTGATVVTAIGASTAASALVTVANATGNTGVGVVTAFAALSLSGGTAGGADFSYNLAKLGLQQKGFYNMTREWFGNTDVSAPTDVDKLWALWPKGDGDDHVTAFRNMASGSIKAAVVWGQNPAVTEPNQSKVRLGLKALETLVCVDIFPNETVECDRDGVTYFIPACSHVEEAGSVTNSGRWIQWRERATLPKGNSKADLELQLRFAKALDDAGAFSHIKDQWATMGVDSLKVAPALTVGKDPWTVLFAKYGWDGTSAFDAISGLDQDGNILTGSEYVADKVFWEISRPLDLATGGGTMWIYSGAGNAAGYTTIAGRSDTQPTIDAAEYTASGASTVAAEPIVLTGTTATALKHGRVTAASVAIVGYTEGTDFSVDYTLGTITRIGAGIPSGGTVNAAYTYKESIVLTGIVASALKHGGIKVGAASVVVKSLDGVTLYTETTDFTVNRGSGTITRVIPVLPALPTIPDGTRVSVDYDYQTYGWATCNRAKSRGQYQGNARSFPRYGFAWLLNRRVFYNNSEVQNDVADTFVAPGLMARMFVINTNLVGDFSLAYRAYNTFKDMPSTELAVGTPHVAGGRIPGHTEPYESPRVDLVTRFGYNTGNGHTLIKPDTLRGEFADFPLVLTTIRCVEHFQGGPITRNNSWNVEAEPVPWIEINSVDARKYGIMDGDWVDVSTARSNSTDEQVLRTPNYVATGAPADAFGKGFKARVGSGLQATQRVAPGVVAIPWHWGDRGLATGSRANDLTIDVADANTVIPEYKACLCIIAKIQ